MLPLMLGDGCTKVLPTQLTLHGLSYKGGKLSYPHLSTDGLNRAFCH